MKNSISIIIPCYNVESYIVKCLDSLIKQLNDFTYEIILVNDCSKDNTEDIINQYIKEHPSSNINYFSNDNNIGAGATRNKAVAKAKYAIVSFIDADDYIDDNFFEEMYYVLTKEDADLVCCDMVLFDEETKEKTRYSSCDGDVNKYNLINNGFSASPCNKLIKKELLLKYPFAEGIMNEDICAILPILANCNKVSYTKNTCYYYLQHQSSVQNSGVNEKRLDIIKAVDIFIERIKGNPEYDKFVESVTYHQIIVFLIYVPRKEKRILKRAKFIHIFGKNTRKYRLKNNSLFKALLEEQGFKSKVFKGVYMTFAGNGLGLLASVWLFIYSLFKG